MFTKARGMKSGWRIEQAAKRMEQLWCIGIAANWAAHANRCAHRLRLSQWQARQLKDDLAKKTAGTHRAAAVSAAPRGLPSKGPRAH